MTTSRRVQSTKLCWNRFAVKADLFSWESKMARNALLTWASGGEFCHRDGFIKAYLRSSRVVAAERFVLTHDMPTSIVGVLRKEGVQVIHVNPMEVNQVVRDRHLHFWKWLTTNSGQFDGFGFTDSRDVIFQGDPFAYLGDLKGRVVLTCEGMLHEQSVWNLVDQFKAQIDTGQFKFPCERRPVINGGIVFGDGECLESHFLLLWVACLKSLGACTDQGVLNFLYNFLDHRYEHTDPRNDTFCLTGEAVAKGCVQAEITSDGWCKSTIDGKPYVIVHQWDRIKEHKVIAERWIGEEDKRGPESN
jgi:hypothetical protein